MMFQGYRALLAVKAGTHAPASIVDDLLHDTLDVTIALSEVESTELGRRLVVVGVRLELEIARDV